jgi:hypothetical protein
MKPITAVRIEELRQKALRCAGCQKVWITPWELSELCILAATSPLAASSHGDGRQ